MPEERAHCPGVRRGQQPQDPGEKREQGEPEDEAANCLRQSVDANRPAEIEPAARAVGDRLDCEPDRNRPRANGDAEGCEREGKEDEEEIDEIPPDRRVLDALPHDAWCEDAGEDVAGPDRAVRAPYLDSEEQLRAPTL